MTIESNYVSVIASLTAWLKNLSPVSQPIRRKTKNNHILNARFFPRFEQVINNYLESDWYIVLFAN